jgi:type IX secretion system PorP/SprF family membrane protein
MKRLNYISRRSSLRSFIPKLRARSFTTNLALLLLLPGFFASQKIQAQQEPIAASYFENRLLINPAYAGARETFSAMALYRHQWAGLEGAPKSTVLSAHSVLPNNNRYALGFSIMDDRLGVTQETSLLATYNYRLPLGPGKIAFGLHAGLSYFRTQFEDLDLIDEDDQAFAGNLQRWIPLAGAGIRFATTDYYVGFSVPRLISSKYGPELQDGPARHYYASAGYVHEINENFRLRPSALMRWNAETPAQIDGDLSLGIVQRLWLGMGYRSSGVLKAYLELAATDDWQFGYVFEQELGAAQALSGNSHEIYIRFDLNVKSKIVLSPRQSGHRNF